MKKLIPYYFGSLLSLFSLSAFAQSELAEDQNPNYAVSQAKYQAISDSVNTWHSTTIQQTYKAIDYLADREAERNERRQFRRDLRMIRASRGFDNWGYNNYHSPYYRSHRNSGYYYNSFPAYQRPNFRYRNNYPVLPWLIPGLWFR